MAQLRPRTATRLVPIIAAIAGLLIAGCGAVASPGQASPPASTDTASGSPSPIGPPAVGAPTTTAQLIAAACAGTPPTAQQFAPHGLPLSLPGRPLAAVVSPPAGGRYTISLVDAQGHVAASATAAARTPVTTGGAAATPLPVVSSSLTKLYYLDGDSQVHYLAADGLTGVATTIAGGPQAHATFAVSPDDSRISVGVIDYSVSPPCVRLYVEDLFGGAHHVDLSPAPLSEWPVAWHAGKVILAAGPAFTQTTFENPNSALFYQVMDPSSSAIEETIGSERCVVTGPLSPAGTACHSVGGQLQDASCGAVICLNALDWTGATTTFLKHEVLVQGALSPEANRIAACCESPDGGAHWLIYMVNAGASGNGLARTAASGSSFGWLDDQHLVFAQPTPAGAQPKILDLTSGAVTPTSLIGTFAGVLPAPLS